MKVLNEKKGFTLIELLAVIVVLAIVMVLAVSTVLPYIAKSRKNAFAIEANTVLDAAQSAISLIQVETISGASARELVEGTHYTKSTDTTSGDSTYCFTLENLLDVGTLNSKKMSASKDTKDIYEGKVTVLVPKNGYKYTYTVWYRNANFYIESNEGTVDIDSVNDMDASHKSTPYTCS